ncbi:hypothetical protein [Clavibacter sp.]|uniref:hypothetical protein n=1 Tax=Clavibacter sp. TaxID=1871044 RepID=UPI0019C35A46|nr:hypothetical protein [Clavibacter sp.]MBD5381995.1 hypothetical protein [Clavibacter sp.]
MPLVLERTEIIDGREEVCLVIPTRQNQLKKGKQGNWYFICRLAEREPNEKMITHDIQLTYVSPEDLQKSYDFGYHKRTAHLGRVYEHDRTPSKKIDRTNNATDIRLDGVIVLSDIDKSLIFRNGENNKRYLSNLTFRGLNGSDECIFTGSVCIDDIPLSDIKTNHENGKKFINVRLRKMNQLDTYFNTHELVIARNDGECVQIGLFKEWRKEGSVQSQNPQSPSNPTKNVPDTLNGLRF